jgi:hypothetical protein
MRRLVTTTTAALLALAAPVAASGGPQPANEQASCVAILTSFEASQLEPGAVGAEVSGLATSSPGFVGAFVRALAKEHAGTIETCFPAEG